MKHLISYRVFESELFRPDELTAKLEDIFDFIRDSDVEVSFNKVYSGLLLRGFSRVVGGGKTPHYSLTLKNDRRQLSFFDFSSELHQCIKMMDEAGYKILNFEIKYIDLPVITKSKNKMLQVYHQGKPITKEDTKRLFQMSYGSPSYTVGSNPIANLENVEMIPGDTIGWCESYFSEVGECNIKLIQLSFIKK